MAQAVVTLAETLNRLTREGELYEKHPDGSLTCFACGHRCLIRPGRSGICKVRYNEAGTPHVPHRHVGGLPVHPLAKQPLLHHLPAKFSPFIWMSGCGVQCGVS